MKKIILGLPILCLLLITVIASEINESITYNPSTLYPISYGTGSQLIINLNVTKDNCEEDIKRTYLSWNISNLYPNDTIDCVYLSHDCLSKKYQCTLTISPFMNGNYEVYAFSLSYDDNISSKKIGDYTFNGQPFPEYSGTTEPLNCSYFQVCTMYKKECNYQVVGHRDKKVRTCEYVEYNVTKTKRVGREIVSYIVTKTKRLCSYHWEEVPIMKKICGYTDECLSWTNRRICS